MSRSTVLTGLKVTLPSFDGKVEEFDDFRFSARAYLGRHALLKKPDTGDVTTEEDSDIYYVLSSCLSGDAISTIRSVPEGSGLEAYKALCDRYAPSRISAKFALLRTVMSSRCENVCDVERWLNQITHASRRLAAMNVSLDEITALGIIDNLPSELKGVGGLCLTSSITEVSVIKRMILGKKDAVDRAEVQKVASLAT